MHCCPVMPMRTKTHDSTSPTDGRRPAGGGANNTGSQSRGSHLFPDDLAGSPTSRAFHRNHGEVDMNNGERWTDQERWRVGQMLRQGFCIADIAHVLHRSKLAVEQYIFHYGGARVFMKLKRPRQRTKQPCLRCKRNFFSEGSHNWLCPSCSIGNNIGELRAERHHPKNVSKQSMPAFDPTIEVCAYTEAPWAPRDIQDFQWAWRVTSPNGNRITGACNGTKSHAQGQAQRAANCMTKAYLGKTTHTLLRPQRCSA